MKEKAWKRFLQNKDLILSVRNTHPDELCEEVLEMDSTEFLYESFYTFISLYNIGADLESCLPKRLIRELNDLHWNHNDSQDLPGLPSEMSNAEVLSIIEEGENN